MVSDVMHQTGLLKLWIPDTQPDILGKTESFGNIEWTSDEIYEHLYDPLLEKYPYKAEKVSLGFETTGKYPMYAYEFTPDQYEKTVYIQSGVHCIETEGYFGLARLLHLITEGCDERMIALRDHVRFLIVPMVSVWGISEKGSYAHIMSEDRYDGCPHNAVRVNSNRDFYEEKAQETVNVKNYFRKNAAAIDLMFDFHTTTQPEWGAYLLPYPTGLDTITTARLVQVDSMLYQKNCTPDMPIAYMGDEAHYPTAPITSGFLSGFFKEYGIPGSVIEHSDYIFDKVLGTETAMTRAVELYGNQVLALTGY